MLGGCHKKKDREAEGPRPVNVAYPTVDSVTLHKTYPGTVSAADEAGAVCRVNGVILTQNYKGGDRVVKGQVLFTIESSKYRDAVNEASSQLATARSEYAYASRQYAAMEKAIKSDAVSQMDVIQARSNMEKAEAAIKSASAALQTARTNLGYCTVRAPITGIASQSTLDPGAYCGGEGSPVTLCTVYNDQSLQVEFSIEDSQYEKMLGNNGGISAPIFRKVPISFNVELPHDYTIDLSYESPSVETSTGTLLVKGNLQNQNNELKDGMYCTVHLPYGTDAHALLIKDASIGTDQLGKYVYVVNDSDKVVYRHIEVGDVYQDSLRMVTKGLTDRDRYVTEAMMNVRTGEKVRPVLGTRDNGQGTRSDKR